MSERKSRSKIVIVLAGLGFGVAAIVVAAVVVLLAFRADTREGDADRGTARSADRAHRVAEQDVASIEVEDGEAVVLTHRSGARIEVPEGAVRRSATVSIVEVEPPESPLEVRDAFDFTVEGARLREPVTLHIPFVLEPGEDADAVHALHWDDREDTWEPVDGVADEKTGTISVVTESLSIFSWLLVAVEASCDASPDSLEPGGGVTVTASGESRTSGTIEIYVETSIVEASGGLAGGSPSSRSEAASVDHGDRFDIKVETAMPDTGEFRVGCRFFWETVFGPVELNSSRPPSTLVTVAAAEEDLPAPEPTAPAVSVDAETLDCGLASEAECELAGMYAPVLVTHPDERYLPRGVEGFVYRSDLVDGGLGPDAPGIEISDPDDLGDAAYGEEHYLDLDGRGDRGGFPPDWPERVPTVYAAVRSSAGALYLQYHIFYYYDHLNPAQSEFCGIFLDVPSFCDPHEADWELIQLEFRADSAATVLDQGLEPEAVAYSQHGWSEDRAWGSPDLEVAGDSHPVAYAALGKHANYFGTYAGAEAGAQALDLCEAARGLPIRPLDATLLGAGPEGGSEAIFEGTGWAPFVCERLEASEGQVSIVLDEISLSGKRLLPPALSVDAGTCRAEDLSPCGYELSFVDDDTPWAAYQGLWGGSGKKIRGPGHGTRWSRPGEWAGYDTDLLLETEPAAAPTSGFVSVSAGGGYTCGVRTDGAVACWGYDNDGQSSPPAGAFVSVSAGLNHSCGVRSDGAVDCWGRDGDGQSSPPAGAFVSVSAGLNHSCGVRSDGAVDCWGHDDYGQSSPPAGAFASFSAGDYHSCGVRSDGAVDCWGRDGAGQSSPPSGAFVSVSAGDYQTCGVKTDGAVECWGDDYYGQSSPPDGVFASVSTSDYHSCGVRSDGAVDCWGRDGDGQSSPPSGGFESVSAGLWHSCGVRTNGAVECWGQDGHGPSTPPDETLASEDRVVTVGAGRSFTEDFDRPLDPDRWSLYGSAGHSMTEGLVELTPARSSQLGYLIHGQRIDTSGLRIEFSFEIADGTSGDGLGMLLLRSVPDFAEIDSFAGGGFWASNRLDGYLVAFDTHYSFPGYHATDWYYPLDDPSDNFVALAELGPPSGVDEAKIRHLAVADLSTRLRNSGVFDVEVEIEANGRFRIYLANANAGMNRTLVIDHEIEDFTSFDGHLGFIGLTGSDHDRHVIRSVSYQSLDNPGPALQPAAAPTSGFASVSAGGHHTCGVRTDGAVECWGRNGDGRSSPPGGTFASVSAGGWHTCGVRTDRTVECWGWDDYGEWSPPAGAFASVSAGGVHTCGVRTDGTVDCWGRDGEGESSPPGGTFASVSLGWGYTCGVRTDGAVECRGVDSLGQSSPPGGTFASVSAGGYHSCGVRSDGSVECWGDDFNGQSSPPGGTFASVSAGRWHTCGVRSDGAVECWGDDSDGQSSPPGDAFVSVSAGGAHSCGVRPDGAVECWGSDEDGQLSPPDGAFASVSSESVMVEAQATPATSASGRIAFSSDSGVEQLDDIYVMNADGSDVVQLTDNDSNDGFPTWSPDGTRIAFNSDRGRDDYGSGDENDYLPAWSPDGTRIAFHSDRGRGAGLFDTFVMDADGSDVVRITHGSGDEESWGPAWSPDGTRIAFYSNRDRGDGFDIYVMDADGSNVVRLTHGSGYEHNYLPDWSPDGTRIAFNSTRGRNGLYFDIYMMDADGSDVVRLTHGSGDEYSRFPDWSPAVEVKAK